MEIQLFVKSKNDDAVRDFVFPLNGRLVLGRGPDSPVPLEGAAISREHLALQLEGDALCATDLSNNGTWINGRRIPKNQKCRAEDGDSIDLPGYTINFQILRAPLLPNPLPGASIQATETLLVKPADGEPVKEIETGRNSLLAPVSAFLTSFTRLERFLMVQALISIALLIYYFYFMS